MASGACKDPLPSGPIPALHLPVLGFTPPGPSLASVPGAGKEQRAIKGLYFSKGDESVSQKCQLRGKVAASARNLPWLVTGKRCFAAQTSQGLGQIRNRENSLAARPRDAPAAREDRAGIS